jgi:hypothetical protein
MDTGSTVQRRPDPADPVVEAYKAGIDRSLIRRNLERTVEERIEALAALLELATAARRAGENARAGSR